ncbi:hypothetical protein IFM89_035069 [Coptis chinensis]|uniref:Uncharacterized protein n=1 Tax=Coptis chinensis TaxID=261450 RepID=A0A835IIQ9_9MAGN|nr:hypothetical protein IFM89_035069 [Coptis chinensis]
MAGQEAPATTKPRRKTATQHGGSSLADPQQALEDYLPEDEAEETVLSNAWYEMLSVLHLMAMLSLSQANLLLLPKTSADGYQPKVSEESKRAAVDFF